MERIRTVSLRDMRCERLNKRATASSYSDLKEIGLVLEEAVLLRYRPKTIEDIVRWVKAQPFFTKPYKEQDKFERNCARHARYLARFTAYRFFFLLGAISHNWTFLALSHAEAWEAANELSVKEYGGNVRAVFCYEYRDMDKTNDPGTLKELASFFTPKIKDRINSVKAIDLQPECKVRLFSEEAVLNFLNLHTDQAPVSYLKSEFKKLQDNEKREKDA